MSLLRLLTAGRSLIGLKEPARYREAGPRALPKFVGKQQPFGATSGSAVAAEPGASASSSTVPVSEISAKPRWFSRWTARWQRPNTSVIPRFSKPLVQGELSLDRVKVMRNDLSDSDLEVVPAGTSVMSASAKQRPGKAESAEPSGATTPELLPSK